MSPFNILLVENDYLFAKGTAKLIQTLSDYQVQVTDTLCEVFRQCEAGAIDLVMIDVNMPVIHWQNQTFSSQDITHHLKHNPKTAHIPIVLVMTYQSFVDRATLIHRFEADACCPTPTSDYGTLLETIDQMKDQIKRSMAITQSGALLD